MNEEQIEINDLVEDMFTQLIYILNGLWSNNRHDVRIELNEFDSKLVDLRRLIATTKVKD